MSNAKKEILEEIGSKEVELIRIVFGRSYGSEPQKIIEGGVEVVDGLDFEYDDGYGSQFLFGYIWYTDGTWSEREEYDGSEWWAHKERPAKDVKIDT
jgi:hypothetical protein